MTQTTDLSLLTAARTAVAEYVRQCGDVVTPTLDGLLAVESANADSWGSDWSDVEHALRLAWEERA